MRIYKITNQINGKIYIGKDELDRNEYMGSGVLIKRAIQKYGIEHFLKEIIEECHDRESLANREKFWISFYQTQDPAKGYNITSGGDGGDTMTNNPNLDKIKIKISEKMKSRKLSTSHKAKLSQRMKGNSYGALNKGRPKSEAHKEKLRQKTKEHIAQQTALGQSRSLTTEQKLKIAQQAKERWARKKANGELDTPEFKNRMRELQKRSIASKLNNKCKNQ